LEYFKNKKTEKNLSLFKVSAPGFEPGTVCLEGRCSIQLSYAPVFVFFSNFKTVPIESECSIQLSYAP
jgi:hypothetical protein